MQAFFLQYRRQLLIAFLLTLTVINIVVLATSNLMDYERNNIPLQTWEPFVWEASSQLVILLLVFFVIWCVERFPLRYGRWWRHGLIHIGCSVVFSVVHIAAMVGIRRFIYKGMNSTYEFGPWLEGFVYEYRKDLQTYWIIVAGIYLYQYFLRQLQGEASLLAEGEDQPVPEQVDKLLVKKKGKEFIIRLADVTSIEAGGNYVYIQANGQTYPLRETMSRMEQRLQSSRFQRVHRSYLVNLDAIKHMETLESGEHQIVLTDGREVPLSRRYRNSLKELFV